MDLLADLLKVAEGDRISSLHLRHPFLQQNDFGLVLLLMSDDNKSTIGLSCLCIKYINDIMITRQTDNHPIRFFLSWPKTTNWLMLEKVYFFILLNVIDLLKKMYSLYATSQVSIHSTHP